MFYWLITSMLYPLISFAVFSDSAPPSFSAEIEKESTNFGPVAPYLGSDKFSNLRFPIDQFTYSKNKVLPCREKLTKAGPNPIVKIYAIKEGEEMSEVLKKNILNQSNEKNITLLSELTTNPTTQFEAYKVYRRYGLIKSIDANIKGIDVGEPRALRDLRILNEKLSKLLNDISIREALTAEEKKEANQIQDEFLRAILVNKTLYDHLPGLVDRIINLPKNAYAASIVNMSAQAAKDMENKFQPSEIFFGKKDLLEFKQLLFYLGSYISMGVQAKDLSTPKIEKYVSSQYINDKDFISSSKYNQSMFNTEFTWREMGMASEIGRNICENTGTEKVINVLVDASHAQRVVDYLNYGWLDSFEAVKKKNKLDYQVQLFDGYVEGLKIYNSKLSSGYQKPMPPEAGVGAAAK